ncbi:uncharacterized protein LOC112588392 [Harpegnathos saltator]|uniref:uncharacterized protein LOC112588392 n=1 Tax=Harpegnathos saltator TaxID=610380 RepID=UPI000DBEF17A|nr:uncharacterized protein LOC112588392 [Harpegnathos saltator]
MLPIEIVSQVPFDMHLVCLGVMKKILSVWVHGKYSRLVKLPAVAISTISARLLNLQQYCPTDFSRRPRSLDSYSKYKATEFRQFLLYTGPVVMYDILDEQLYKHFLLLHAAIRILLFKCHSQKHLTFAELALQKFVFRANTLFGSNFNSYNVHGLLHLTNDVRRLGSLESFSAFPYENNMSIFRKYCRKPGLPLQQFANRMTEMQYHGRNDTLNIDSFIHVSMPCKSSENSNSYNKIEWNGIRLSTRMRDNCCILIDRSICLVFNIITDNNFYCLAVKRFLEVHNFYNVGLPSSAFHVYKYSNICSDIVIIDIK